MNSSPFWGEIKRTCAKIQNGYQLMRAYFENCMIPNVSEADRAAIAALVQHCLDAKGGGVRGVGSGDRRAGGGAVRAVRNPSRSFLALAASCLSVASLSTGYLEGPCQGRAIRRSGAWRGAGKVGETGSKKATRRMLRTSPDKTFCYGSFCSSAIGGIMFSGRVKIGSCIRPVMALTSSRK